MENQLVYVNYIHSDRIATWINVANLIPCTMDNDLALLQKKLDSDWVYYGSSYKKALKRPADLEETFAIAYTILKKLYVFTWPSARLINQRIPTFDLQTGKTYEETELENKCNAVNYRLLN